MERSAGEKLVFDEKISSPSKTVQRTVCDGHSVRTVKGFSGFSEPSGGAVGASLSV